jgi:hypothetical protein
MQLKLSDAELGRLASRIETDYDSAISDHNARIDRFRRYYRMWRNKVPDPDPTRKQASNFRIPMLQWHLFGKWSQIVEGLFGDDAEIRCKPIGPSDEKKQKKAQCFANWRFFSSMKGVEPMAVMSYRMLVYGRSFAYSPWVQDKYWQRDPDTGEDREQTWYEGPGFEPRAMDDLIFPAEDATTLHDFSWMIDKGRFTPQQLLDGERDGRYFGIENNFEKILAYASNKRQRDERGDTIRREQDHADGITMDYALSAKDSLLCFRWYGKWRLPKGKDGGNLANLKRRRMDESDIVVTYLPDLRLIIGVQDLADVYPLTKDRRPFVEMSLIKDGSYWCMGLGELLEMIEGEATANNNLFTEAGQFSVGPIIAYRPGSGFKPESFKYEPFTMLPCENPQDIQPIYLKADMTFPITKEQQLYGLAERVTGVSELAIGRSSSAPNQPRTATGQMAMIEAGNTRVAMDLRFLREDVKKILGHFWLLEQQFAPPNLFFRVTEEDAGGLFDIRQGGALMTGDELAARYDFDIQFATSIYQREAQAQKELQLYQLDMQNPLVMQNPRALWKCLNKVHQALGDRNFASIIPEPPDIAETIAPKEEWVMMLQGEEVDPRPMDNDDFHIIDHLRRIEQERKSPQPDQGAINLGISHVAKHQAQKKQKMLMQAMAQQIAQQASQATQTVMGPIEQAVMQQAGQNPNVGAQPNGPQLQQQP